MIKRLFDVIAAFVGLVLALPILAVAAVAIRAAGPGPILYRARRTGLGGRVFTMYKLRTMRLDSGPRHSRITGLDDPRVFPAGRMLRRAKIDELPQLWNVLIGDMSIVGPRPEDPGIVAVWYAPRHWETLSVRPGLTSPGTLYQYTAGDRLLDGDDPEARYLGGLLPVKLAFDLLYVHQASFRYDLRLIARTIGAIAGTLFGRRFREPPELRLATGMVVPLRRPRPSEAFGAMAVLLLALAACTEPDPDARAPIWPDEPAAPVLVGAGDIATCDGDGDEATAALLDRMPGTVFTAGDNVYPNGTPEEYAACYGPSWGRHLARTRPAAGNHDYRHHQGAGYYAYLGQRAGPPGLGYYSYDLGAWHIVVLNSELDVSEASAQVAWLVDDLARNGRSCTAAYWHRPLFTSGDEHPGFSTLEPVWRVLYDAGVEIVLNGHAHNYERFDRQRPDGTPDERHGIRQFIVGTGGFGSHGFGPPVATSARRIDDVFGVLALRLRPQGYDWRFYDADGLIRDTGSDTCHAAPALEGR